MRIPTAALLAVACWLGATPLRAVDAGDDFDDNTIDYTRWEPDLVFGDGSLSETNEHVEFTVGSSTKFDQARQGWILTQFATTNNWETQIDIVNLAELTANNQITSFGLFVINSADPGDIVTAELYASQLGGAPVRHGFYAQLDANRKVARVVDTRDLGATNAAVRITFDSPTKTLTAHYDADSSDGYDWVAFAVFGVDGTGSGIADGLADWKMSTTDRFNLLVYGSSQKTPLAGGTVYGDNLWTTGGVPFGPPPTPLTGAFGVVAETCKTPGVDCTLKGKLTVTNVTAAIVVPTRLRIFLSANTSYEIGVDTLLLAFNTGELKPAKTRKLKVKLTRDDSVSGLFLLAVDDSGAVLDAVMVP